MNQYLGLTQRFLMLTASFVASYVSSNSPTYAATFGLSQADLILTDFSQSPSETFTKTNTNTLSISQEGQVLATSEATAFIQQDSQVGLNSSFSLTSGENKNYMGLATSKSEIRGIFNIQEKTLFSFNFSASLNLFASIDNYPGEKAKAGGEISFALLDLTRNTTLDFFNVTSNLNTMNNNDFLNYQQQGGVTLNPPLDISNFGDKQESAQFYVTGFSQRYFDSSTTVALIAFTKNQVQVSAPEPANGVALFICGSVIFVGIKCKRQKL